MELEAAEEKPVDLEPVFVEEQVDVKDVFDVSKPDTEATIEPQENGEFQVNAMFEGENVSQTMAQIEPPFVLMYDPSVKNFKTFPIDPGLKFVRYVG